MRHFSWTEIMELRTTLEAIDRGMPCRTPQWPDLRISVDAPDQCAAIAVRNSRHTNVRYGLV